MQYLRITLETKTGKLDQLVNFHITDFYRYGDLARSLMSKEATTIDDILDIAARYDWQLVTSTPGNGTEYHLLFKKEFKEQE